MRRLDIPKEYLEEHYVRLGKTMKMIGEELQCSPASVNKYVNLYGLQKEKDGYIPIGKKFYNLTVISRVANSNGRARWECKCDCGETRIVSGNNLRSNNSKSCRSCKIGNASPLFKGVGKIHARYLKSIKNGARNRNLEVYITLDDMWKQFCLQNGECALSGIKLVFANTIREYTTQTASLDRIDSSKGYVRGNIQWVHKNINTMKWDLTQDRFIELCKTITEYQEEIKSAN